MITIETDVDEVIEANGRKYRPVAYRTTKEGDLYAVILGGTYVYRASPETSGCRAIIVEEIPEPEPEYKTARIYDDDGVLYILWPDGLRTARPAAGGFAIFERTKERWMLIGFGNEEEYSPTNCSNFPADRKTGKLRQYAYFVKVVK